MDATFWATIALFILLGGAWYLGIFGTIGRALDARGQAVRDELAEARRLREEARSLRDDYQRRREEAEIEAREMVEAARREAQAIREEAERKTADDVTRRTAMAEARIARAESEAVREVKARAVDLAMAATSRLVAERGAGDDFDGTLEQVRGRLN